MEARAASPMPWRSVHAPSRPREELPGADAAVGRSSRGRSRFRPRPGKFDSCSSSVAAPAETPERCGSALSQHIVLPDDLTNSRSGTPHGFHSGPAKMPRQTSADSNAEVGAAAEAAGAVKLERLSELADSLGSVKLGELVGHFRCVWSDDMCHGRDTAGSDGSIASRFNKRGILGRATPGEWTLVACNQYPLHSSREHQEGVWGLSTRRQQVNARKCMEKDQMRIDRQIEACVKEREMHSVNRELEDAQHFRYMSLLFEGIDGLPRALLEELSTNVLKDQKQEDGTQRLDKCLHKGGTRVGMSSFRRASDFRDTQNSRTGWDQRQGAPSGGGKFTNRQHSTLLSIFQRYVVRVSGGVGRSELMRRSTWFKFLHHCGLLGHEGGISYARASEVFAQYTDAWASPSSLTFIGWIHSMLRLLKGPKFFEKDDEIIKNLFGIYLVRCDERLTESNQKAEQARKRASKKRQSSKAHPKRMEPGQTQTRLPEAGSSVVERLDWHVLVAEEMMCEPEVIQLVEAHEDALRKLFVFFVGREKKRGSRQSFVRPEEQKPERGRLSVQLQDFPEVIEAPESPPATPPGSRRQSKRHSSLLAPRAGPASGRAGRPTSPCVPASPSCLAPPAPAQALVCSRPMSACSNNGDSPANLRSPSPSGMRRHSSGDLEQRISRLGRGLAMSLTRDGFEDALKELRFVPDIVQSYALRHQVSVSMKRRHLDALDYTCFVECIWRMAFVHLHFYGNPTQHGSSSKCKCLWLLAMLRIRCRDLGKALKLPAELVGSDEVGSRAWSAPVKLDLNSTSLQDLLFWQAIDATLPSPAAGISPPHH